MRYFLIRHSKWRSMTTCHTSRKSFLSLPRLSSSFSFFIFLRRPPQPRTTSARYTHCMPPFTYSLLSTFRSITSFYSFTLRIPCRFLLPSFFGATRGFAYHIELLRDVEKRKSRSLLELRSEAMEMKRARFIYFPEFCRNALQSRMKQYVEIGALCCASCCSLKKKFREKGRRTHDRRVCALYEYVICWRHIDRN